MFKLELSTDNAAFDGGECANEVARILRDVADLVEARCAVSTQVRDINGNVVGRFILDKTQEL